MTDGPVSSFMKHHLRHFNFAALLDAAEAYCRHLETEGCVLLAMAGAMSTAEIGLSFQENLELCIPEEAIKRLVSYLREEWFGADRRGECFFPHAFFYRLLRRGCLEPEF